MAFNDFNTTMKSKLPTNYPMLLPEIDLEQYSRDQVQGTLENATRNCGVNKAYKKGRRSFQVLEAADPNILKQRLPCFRRFIETLEKPLS